MNRIRFAAAGVVFALLAACASQKYDSGNIVIRPAPAILEIPSEVH